MKKLFIFGTGPIAEVAFHHFKEEKKYDIVAFVEFKKFIRKKKIFNTNIVEYEKIKKILPKENHYAFVALGYKELNKFRTKIYKNLKKKKYKFVSYVSPNSNIAKNVSIGENCLLLDGQIIHPYTKIGNNVTLWSGNIIGHHCEIKDNCFITSDVTISGNSLIGENSFIGIKTAVRDGISVGKNCVIFMCSSITQNMPDGSTALSTPSKIYDKKNKDINLIKKRYFGI